MESTAPNRRQQIAALLKRYWGFDTFRPVQEQVILSVLAGRDTLALMPTGGGKSLTYQIPGLASEGVCIVVTPLIALMKDQVDRLRKLGIRALAIHSGLSARQIDIDLDNCVYGDVKFLYVAPERLASEAFRLRVQRMNVSLLAVDEAHCISQWGYDFRPSYLRIAELRERIPGVPVLALTASATPRVADDIMEKLRFAEPHLLRSDFSRPNLSYAVRHTDDKNEQLLRIIRNVGGSGIVYVRTREGAEQVAAFLRDEGISAEYYHGGLGHAERSMRQEAWISGRTPVMVATNAFGMGIDKSDVRFVIHYNMPKSLEAYYQEAGRAGRDGTPAECILLFSPGDVQTARFLIEHSGNEELSEAEQDLIRKRDAERLDEMIGYCKTARCLRGYILDYFGQRHEETCENCGNCKGSHQMMEVTVHAQMILSCVLRIREKLGYAVGKTLLVKTLRGSKDQNVLRLGLDRISTYGLMDKLSAGQVRARIDFLLLEGYLQIDAQHAVLEPTPAASPLLRGQKKLLMPVRLESRKAAPARRHRGRALAAGTEESAGLFAALKAVRMTIARQENVPAYVVFSNATLMDMADKAPCSMAEFLEVSGVGEVKAERYGQIFLDAIIAYQQEH